MQEIKKKESDELPEGLAFLWNSIKDKPVERDNLSFFIYFGYIIAKEEFEKEARASLWTHPLAKSIHSIFNMGEDPYRFIFNLHRKLKIPVHEIINLLFLYDRGPAKDDLWFKLATALSIPLPLIPASFTMKELSIDWSFEEKLNRHQHFQLFHNLHTVQIYCYSRHVFPDPKMSFINTKYLKIAGRLKRITADVKLMLAVQHLEFGFMKLKKIPRHLFEIPSLVTLKVNENFIEDLPSLAIVNNSLERLELSRNQLDTLPDSFCLLENLQTLSLALNRFQQFPLSIFSLKTMKSLDMNENQLKEIPANIIELTKLETLLCYHNSIENISNEIINLRNLRLLDIRFNPIAKEKVEWLRSQMPWLEIRFY